MINIINSFKLTPILFLLLFLLANCTRNHQDAEGFLKYFIEERMGSKVSKDFLLEHVTGKMKDTINSLSEEEFETFADLSQFRKDSLKIISKSCQISKCFVTYSLGYANKASEDFHYKTEVKKIAEIVYEEKKWLIADVVNVKTHHESLQPINP